MNTQNTTQSALTAESVQQVCQILFDQGHIISYSIGRSEITGEVIATVFDQAGEEFYMETNLHGVWHNWNQPADTMDPHYGAGHDPETAAAQVARVITN